MAITNAIQSLQPSPGNQFKYESNRRLYALRKACYNDATSADAARCSDVLYAINKKTERPKEQRSEDFKEDAALLREWNRVMEIATNRSAVSHINSSC